MSFARRGVIALAVLMVAGSASAAGNPVQGRILANTCMGCHGIPGWSNVYPTYRVPKLGGQNEQYIVSALDEYENGNRKHPTMHIQASALSKQDKEDIASFLTQAPHSPEEAQ